MALVKQKIILLSIHNESKTQMEYPRAVQVKTILKYEVFDVVTNTLISALIGLSNSYKNIFWTNSKTQDFEIVLA